jgi:hypothetical protein
MSMRSEWQAAKTKAKGHNNNTEVKFSTKEDLGKLMDSFELAEKAYEKAKGKDMNKAWATTTEAWVAAAKAVQKAAVTYQQDLGKLTTVNHVTKQELDTYLVMHVLATTTKVAAEGKRMEKLIAKAKTQK